MDFGRPRDNRDSRGGGRGGYGRPAARFSRDSPPPSIPLRSPYLPPTPSFQIPLRPAGPQRFASESSTPALAHTAPAAYWRPDGSNQLPARPVQRYRSPPLAGIAGLPVRGGWESASTRGRDSRGGWGRDEYRSEGGARGWREGDRDGWDRGGERERGRSFSGLEGGGRRFEVPYRQQVGPNSRKRTRESSDEDDRDDDQFSAGRERSRAGSVEWRGRNGQNGGRDGFDRGQRRMGEGKGYSNPPLRYPDDGRNDRRRPPSPAGSDTSYEPPTSRRPSNYDRDRDSPRRARSYSPGEISEGLPRRSPSPSSRSRSRSPPPSRDERSDRRDADDFRRRIPSNAEILRPKQEEGRTKDSRPPTNGYPFQQLDQGAAFAAAQRTDAAVARPPSPRPLPSKPPPLRRPSPDRDGTPPRSPRPRESIKFVPRADYAKPQAASPPPPPIMEEFKVEETVVELEVRDVSMRDQDEASTEQAVPRPQGRPPSPYQRSAASPSPERQPQPPPRFEPAPPTITLPRQPQPPADFAPTLIPVPIPPPPVLPQPNSPPSTLRTPADSQLSPPLPASYHKAFPTPSPSALSAFPQPRLPPIATPSSIPPSDTLPIVPAATEDALPAAESSSTEPDAPAAVERASISVFRTPKADVEPLPLPMEVDEELIERHAVLEADEEQRSLSPPPVSSSPPISPPRDFSSILGRIIVANEEESDLASALIESNRARTEKERTSEARIQDLTNRDSAIAQANHERLCPFLLDSFSVRDERRGQKMVQLRRQYKARNEDWNAHCRRLDRIKDKVHRRQPTATPSAPSIDQSGLPFYAELVTPGPSIVGGGRANRRNANYGDAVRSEAEFLEILASLETADMHDPDIRATRTAAVVPDIVIDDSERRDLLVLEDDRRRVSNPVEFYDLRAPLDVWTEEEVQIFCKRFSQHPKQFGKIAADLPEKSTAQAVLFYYRMKNTIDFRSLSDRRGRDGRRRKTRRRTDADGNAKKSASLIENIKRARINPRDEEDDSPPPSPRSTHRSLPAESPSVFQSGPTSRPLPPSQQLFDDDSAPASKKARTPKTGDSQLLPPMSSLLPSDGMMEAAEALGALAGVGNVDGDEADDDGNRKPKKRKVVDGEPDAKVAARRKTASSSYWTVAERNEFVRLLGVCGKDWTRLAEGLENKTAVQCRNWYQNHAKKLNFAEALRNGGFDDEDDGATTPGGDFTVPLGVPLSDAFGPSGVAVPRAGFFLPEGRSPRLPTLDLDDASVKAGMQFRNLLNDDTPDEEVPPPVRDDWFGGGVNGGGGDAESVTTEDESDVPKPQARSPARRPDSFPARPQDAYAPPFAGDPRYTSNGTPVYRHPPPSSYSSSYPPGPQDRRFEAAGRQGPATNGHWQSSPASAYATYGTPPASSDFYRRPLDSQDVRGHYSGPNQANRQEYFPPQKPAIHTYDRNYNIQRPSYPPPPTTNFPQDPHRPPPPPPPHPQHGQWPANSRR